MIFNMVGGSGGLNFEVVGGTTQPTNPKENTIWVNTSTDITGWAFGVTEPSSPVEGMVWIETGTESVAVINVVKKNEINVYPLAAYQYISGAWVDKEAFVYQNEEWTGWIKELWIVENGKTEYQIKTPSGADGTGTISYPSGYLQFKGTDTGYWAVGFGPFDMSNFNTLKLTGSFDTGSGAWGHGLSVNKSCQYWGSYAAASGFSTSGATVDVSELTGKYYVIVNSQSTQTQKIKDLYLIK